MLPSVWKITETALFCDVTGLLQEALSILFFFCDSVIYSQTGKFYFLSWRDEHSGSPCISFEDIDTWDIDIHSGF